MNSRVESSFVGHSEEYNSPFLAPASYLAGNTEQVSLDNNGLELATPQDSDDLRKSAESFLRPRRRLFSLFARDSSLNFRPSQSADTFAFYPQNFTVEVPLNWFASEKFNEGELEFANYHELSHFIDMRKNPQAFLDNFKHIEARANDLARDYLRSHPNAASQDSVSAFFYQELHTLYNYLDDIYVNNIVASRIRKYDTKDGQEDIVGLYKKAGYEEPDLTKEPLHLQMVISLLRDEMVGDVLGKSIVSEEVSEALSKRYLGKTIPDIINDYLKPQRGVLIDPAKRYEIIRTIIEPAYLELLKKALEQQEHKDQKDETQDKNSQGGQPGNSRSSDTYQTQDPNNDSKDQQDKNPEFSPFDGKDFDRPGDILDKGLESDVTMKDILKAFAEQDKLDEMSPEERANYEQKKRQQEFDGKHNITQEQRTEDTRIKAEISDSRRELYRFWRQLIGRSIEYRTVVEPRHQRGHFNVNEYIRQYPQIVASVRSGNLRDVPIYDRHGLERTVVDQPESIEVSLLVDCSGSMSFFGRVDAAKKTAALLLYSLKDFNNELNRTRHQTHSKLRADTQIICFGSTFTEVKPFDRGAAGDTRDANIIKTVSAINSKYGLTSDDLAFQYIEQGISREDRNRIKAGKLKKIVFEITDGNPDDTTATSLIIRKLAEDGVIVVGFRIGDISQQDGEKFQQAWSSQNHYGNVKGITLGQNIASLPNELMRSLSSILSNIRI